MIIGDKVNNQYYTMFCAVWEGGEGFNFADLGTLLKA